MKENIIEPTLFDFPEPAPVESANQNLHRAKREKNDEFYTRLEDIANEVALYDREFFNGKRVYCPCDGENSNFFVYFKDNFDRLGLKSLTITKYNPVQNGHGEKVVFCGREPVRETLNGNGDFASSECVKLMAESDIVVTNPPFSLFRRFIGQIMSIGNKFLVIGNSNAITYKEIYKLIQVNKLWVGRTHPKIFEVPLQCVENPKTQFEKDGKIYQKFGNICWFTNLTHDMRDAGIQMTKTYAGRESMYPKYENKDAIEIGHKTSSGKWEGSLDEIPYDYDGVMGVPITFLDRYNPDQFEIVGFRKGDDGKDLRFNGIEPYFRVLVKIKKQSP